MGSFFFLFPNATLLTANRCTFSAPGVSMHGPNGQPTKKTTRKKSGLPAVNGNGSLGGGAPNEAGSESGSGAEGSKPAHPRLEEVALL